jgi:hypothetical protein
MKVGKKDTENQNPHYLVMKLQNGAIFLKSFAVPQNLNVGVIIYPTHLLLKKNRSTHTHTKKTVLKIALYLIVQV